MKLRLWIARALWAGASALGIGILSGMMTLVLGSLGDRSGAEAVRGVMLVCVAVFVVAFVSLVVLLAINELMRSDSIHMSPSDEITPRE